MAYIRDYNYWGEHANPKVLYDNQDTEFLYHNVQSMRYTDYAEGSSDEIIIELTDQDRDWIGGWFPEKGHLLNVYIDYYNWFLNCENGLFNYGWGSRQGTGVAYHQARVPFESGRANVFAGIISRTTGYTAVNGGKSMISTPSSVTSPPWNTCVLSPPP